MAARRINPTIARAVLKAKMLRIRTAREAYEFSVGTPINDWLWQRVADDWEWHFAQPSETLRARKS